MHLVLSRCVLFLCRHQFHSVCCMCHVCSHVWSLRCGNAAISLENVSSVKKATKVTHSSLYMHIPIPVDDRGCELTQAVPAGAAVSLGCQPPDCPGAILLCFFLLHVKACVALRLLSGRSGAAVCLTCLSSVKHRGKRWGTTQTQWTYKPSASHRLPLSLFCSWPGGTLSSGIICGGRSKD